MTGLWRNNEETSEGKYPIVLRRDGTPVTDPYFVILLHDPCAQEALFAYANKAEELGMDEQYVKDLRDLVIHSGELAKEAKENPKPPDPDAPRHREDDPKVIAWARSLIKDKGQFSS